MTTSIAERWNSRDRTLLETESAELRYVVRGTEDDAEVADLVADTSPTTYGGLPRRSISIRPEGSSLIWDCTVTYGKKDPATTDRQTNPPQTGDIAISFDTSGGTLRMTQSLETVGSHASIVISGVTIPVPGVDFKQAINVTKDGVEGVDIYSPTFSFQITKYVARDEVTDAYIGNLFNLTARVNNGNFRGFDAGQVLFLGASGSARGEEDFEITYKFLCSENKTGLTVGDIEGIDKKGWEYLWVSYEEFEDEESFRLVKRPYNVNVEKVYEDGDFSLLGLDS